MISIIHYISAQRRLTEAQKTVIMLGGKFDERDVPPMVRAQRDMIKLERDYYRDKAVNWILICVFSAFFVGVYFMIRFLKGDFQ